MSIFKSIATAPCTKKPLSYSCVFDDCIRFDDGVLSPDVLIAIEGVEIVVVVVDFGNDRLASSGGSGVMPFRRRRCSNCSFVGWSPGVPNSSMSEVAPGLGGGSGC